MGFVERKPRLKYPLSERPPASMLGFTYSVVDISETGTKIKAQVGLPIKEGESFPLMIMFADKTIFKVKAKLMRNVGDLYMIQFHKPLPIDILKKEYGRLSGKFGDVQVKA